MPIRYEKKNQIAYITIDGPGDLNPMSPPMYQEMVEVLVDFRDDPDLSVAIMTGAGEKAFSVGGDLKWTLEQGQGEFSPERYTDLFWHPRARRQTYWRSFEVIRLDLWKPIIGAINGYCLGAAFIMMCNLMDIRIAAKHAQFGLSETKLGLAGAGAVTKLPLQIPHAIAMYMILTGNRIDAEEAYRVGLVNKVVPLTELMPTAEQIARDICELPPFTARVEKESTLRGLLSSREEALRIAESLQAVKTLQGHLLGDEPLEGVRAFREKRKTVRRHKIKENI